MNIRSKKRKNTIFIALEGEATIYNALELKAHLVSQFGQGRNVEMDLSQVTELDSAGVQILMLAKRELSLESKALRLTAHSRAVLDIFELYNLAPFFGDPLLISNAS